MKSIYLSLVLFLSFTVCFGQDRIENPHHKNIHIDHKEAIPIAEIDSEYPGGLNSLREFIANQIKYPELAIEKRTQGRVIIKFVIERDGSISNVTILKDIGDGCGQEAIRVLKMTKKWKPAMQNMKPIRAYFIFPVDFILPSTNPKLTDSPE